MKNAVTDKQPSECKSLSEVRDEIDRIDRFIIELLRHRFDYVKEVVRYKEKTEEGIQANGRRQAVLSTRRQWAEELGMSPDVVERIYDQLIEYFIEEEKKIVDL